MSSFKGIIIEESLENKDILKKVKILTTEVEKTTEKDQTPWLLRWTLHTFEIPENEARTIAEEISQSIDRVHTGSWYADFKNTTHHYIIFRDRIFYINRADKGQYDEVKNYGLSLGIPEHELDF